ncbi:MAG: long-chain acyl-CoA synthetase [Enterobacterales bacterium]|jgi:long-chain acyl-CoA synthetase
MKPWHKNYKDNVAHEIDTSQYHSMIDVFHKTVETFEDKTAFISFESELSFNELDRKSRDFAAYLQSQLGIVKADRVAIMCPNILPFIVAMWGIVRTGAVQVNVNPLYTPRELKHQLNDADVDTIIIFSASTPVLAEIIDETPIKNIIVVKLDDFVNKGLPDSGIDDRLNDTSLFMEAISQGQSLNFEEPKIERTDLMFLQYTGGTTGLSKGAMLTHDNIIANVLQVFEFNNATITLGEELVVTAIPLYHIFALVVNSMCFFTIGARNVLIANPRDMPAFVNTWSKYQVSIFTGVNTLFNGLLHTEGFEKLDFSRLHFSLGGGAPVQIAVSDKWQKITGKRITEGYGLSETSPVLTTNDEKDGVYIPGIGVPLPSTDITIRDENDNILNDGETGELCAKGPQVMPGYWNNPEATAESMTADGYFKTGDIAFLDELGFFHIVDRKKDMILVSGFNVYPNEIEAEISQMPGILEAACIGVEDETTGEATKLFLVKTDPAITKDEVTEFCRKGLSAYKVPKQIVFLDELPKSSVGKILRRELRD